MISVGLFVRLEAKPGKEAELGTFLRSVLTRVQGEPATTVWFAIRFGPTSFGIFDAFPTGVASLQAYLDGPVAAALLARAAELLATAPTIERVETLACKLN